MFSVAIRTLIVYFFLIAAMRLTGKRQIGQLQLSELITAFLLSELAALPITDLSIPIIYSIIPIALIISLEVAVSYLANQSPFLKKLIDGVPSIIINKGVLDEKELKKLRMGIDEFLGELRIKNISDISEVEYAILEENGQLSVFPKDTAKTLTVGDLNCSDSCKGISHALIIDGRISKFNMELTKTDNTGLSKMLGNRAVEDFLLLTVDDNGRSRAILKDKQSLPPPGYSKKKRGKK